MPRSRTPPPATASLRPRLEYQADPLGQSVRRLGQKWTLLLLRDMAFLKLGRFTEFLRNNPGLTPRVLSRRLKEMRAEQLIRRQGSGRGVTYTLTPRGQDAVYILLAFLQYGLKHHRSRGAPPPSG
ncbi:MAG TPA: helix-turn-helix domain-containing protein [Thermoplasmata archaeon]|nr:helix-turn-helix domain-containing protein [Thermoplasmata archaeon]